MKQYQKLFLAQGIQLEFTEEALTRIAAKPALRKIGARGLKSVIEEAFMPQMFGLFRKGEGNRRVVVTPEVLWAGG